MAAKLHDRNSNVIAFPQAPRTRAAIRCEDEARTAICSYCGGLLGAGESEDDCSSAPFADRRKEAANAYAKTTAASLAVNMPANDRAVRFRKAASAFATLIKPSPA